jgi:hypothetical protein
MFRRVLSRRSSVAVLAAALAGAAPAGCGGDERAAAAPPPAALAAAEVPYLESRARTLTAQVVAREAADPALAGRLADWGYEGGSSRYFQGQSRRLQVVDSRTLRFRTPAGAASFMRFVRANPGSFFPGAGPVRAFSSEGRRGIVVEGLPCSCHLATPALFSALPRGTTVSTLEINGPRATVRALKALAAAAP